MGLILIAARWLIAGLFLRSGLAKATDLSAFRLAVANYRILPPGLAVVVAAVLPFAEIMAGLLLVAGIIPVVVAAVLAVLLLAFAAAIAVNLARGRVFDCGCAGSAVAPSAISWRHVLLDVGLAAISAGVAIDTPRAAEIWPGPGSLLDSPAHASDLVPLVLVITLALTGTMLARRALVLRALTSRVTLQLGSGAPEPASRQS